MSKDEFVDAMIQAGWTREEVDSMLEVDKGVFPDMDKDPRLAGVMYAIHLGTDPPPRGY